MADVAIRDDRLDRLAPLEAIVRCPISKTPLVLAPLAVLLARLNAAERARIPQGTVGAFVSEASSRAYPVIGRICSFLESDVLRLSQAAGDPLAPLVGEADVKLSVKSWYDDFGWKRAATGLYNDTQMYSQLRLTGHGLYEVLSHLSLVGRFEGGELILDAASGAIAHPGYLAYSWFYRHRVCVDLSLTALREAEAKLGDGAFFCLADMCRLPFRDDSFHAVVSGYTIQHIPASEQREAVTELYRVLSPASHLCIVTNVAESRGHQLLLLALRAMRKLTRIVTGSSRGQQIPSISHEVPTQFRQLYCFLSGWTWWRRVARELTPHWSVEGLRVFSKSEFELLFGSSRLAANTVRRLESLFPRLASLVSVYVLVDVCKPSRTRSSSD